MKNSMYEPQDLKDKDPWVHHELFDGSGVQVYVGGEQVFNVLAAATFSDRDKEYNPEWFDFVKVIDGSIKTGDIKIVVNGVESTSKTASSVAVEDCPLPPK